MRSSLKAILAGTVAIMAAGAIAPALARDGQSHVMSVRLPDGTLEQIQYTGDTPPQVVVAPAPIAVAQPMFGPAINLGPGFAELEQISAILDQQAAAMMRQVTEMPMMAESTFGGLPPGTSGYSLIATNSGTGVCTRSVQITYRGGDAKPQMVSHTSGNCGPDQGAPAPTQLSAPAPLLTPAAPHHTIEVKADGRRPYIAMTHPVAWER